MTYPGEADLEAPEADAAEQAMSAVNDDEDDTGYAEGEQDPEAPEWDVQEQHHPVGMEDDDYR